MTSLRIGQMDFAIHLYGKQTNKKKKKKKKKTEKFIFCKLFKTDVSYLA